MEKAVQALLTLVVVGSALALGSVHVASVLSIAVCTTAATVIAIRTWPGKTWPEILRSPIVLGLGLATFTLLQAIPLPMSLLRRIAPGNADVWSRSLTAFGEPAPTWGSLSLDPGASMVEATKWLVYTGIFACSMFVARRRGRAWGITLVFASGITIALVTVAHGLAGASKVYGWYRPHFTPAPWHIGPLLNSNNLAGYLNLAAMCGVGLLLSRQTTMPRWVAALGTMVLGAVVVLAASRGGAVALLVGLLLLAVLLGLGTKASAGSSLPKRTAALLLLAATGGGALFAALGSTRETWAELYDKNLLKVRMLGWAKPMIADHPWFGIGRGAFESVFPAYRVYNEHVVFTHAENFPAQWMAEWGLPVALVGLGAFAWFLRPAAVGMRRSILAAGVAVGIGILLLQNLFDLGLEVSSICIALAVAFGSIWGGWDRSARRWRDSEDGDARATSHVGWLVAAGMAVITALVVFPFQGLHDIATDREDVYELFRAWVPERAQSGSDTLRQRLRSATRRHPADPYFPLLAAEVAWLGGTQESPIPALARALERAAQNGRAHLLLADILLAHGARSQARLELRLAVVDDPGVIGAAANTALKAGTTNDELLETVPPGLDGVRMLDALYVVAPPEARLALLQELLKRDPANARGQSHLASFYLSELLNGEKSSICAGTGRTACSLEFERSVAVVDQTYPMFSHGAQLRARLLLAEGKAEQAENLLATRCAEVEDRASCYLARAYAAAAIRGKPEVLQTAVKELQQVACGSSTECAATATTIGDILAARAEWGTALTHYKRACADDPNDSRWIRLADASSRVGLHAQAADALEKAAQLRGGADAALRARIENERSQALGIVLQ
jgi:tetratricopeptide (TPR) repeat protein